MERHGWLREHLEWQIVQSKTFLSNDMLFYYNFRSMGRAVSILLVLCLSLNSNNYSIYWGEVDKRLISVNTLHPLISIFFLDYFHLWFIICFISPSVALFCIYFMYRKKAESIFQFCERHRRTSQWRHLRKIRSLIHQLFSRRRLIISQTYQQCLIWGCSLGSNRNVYSLKVCRLIVLTP